MIQQHRESRKAKTRHHRLTIIANQLVGEHVRHRGQQRLDLGVTAWKLAGRYRTRYGQAVRQDEALNYVKAALPKLIDLAAVAAGMRRFAEDLEAGNALSIECLEDGELPLDAKYWAAYPDGQWMP